MSQRRKRQTPGRRVWVFSQLNHDLQPEQIARILVAASLEQAQREADARRLAAEMGNGHDVDGSADEGGRHD
jgi:dihydrofolate reductase